MQFYFLNRKNQWSKVKTTLQGPGNQSKNTIGQNFDPKKKQNCSVFQIGNLPLFTDNVNNLLPDFFLDLPTMKEGIKSKAKPV